MRYSAEHLIASIRMSALLRHRGALADAIRLAVHVVVPMPAMRQLVLRQLEATDHLPIGMKPHSVTRHLLTVDTALMLATREDLKRPSSHEYLHWFFIDSSPQAKRNWLLSVSDAVRKTDVVGLFRAYVDLANCASDETRAELREKVRESETYICRRVSTRRAQVFR